MGYGIPADNRAAKRPLGIVTKNSAPPPFDPVTGEGIDRETGEILARSPQSARAERWALKSVVNKLLTGDRVSKCMVLRAPIPGRGLSQIEVHKGQTHGKAFYHGLMACGSVWTCPVCAAKIAERRRVELQQALESAKAKGWGIHFVTLTVPHGIGDDLHEILGKLSTALKKLSGNAPFKKAKAQTGLQIYGYIRAQEVTYGANGWHPHFHLLVFTQWNMGSSIVRYCYDKAWRSACVASGLPEPHQVHGCTVQDGRKAAKYVSKWGIEDEMTKANAKRVSKWGIEDEMTKANAKRGKRHGLSPWGLLRAVLDGNAPEIAPEPAAALFRLYAHAFKGRRQLHWSVGLRAKLLPEQVELSDQQIVERPDDERAVLLAELSSDDWKAIRRVHGQAAVLEAAERGKEELASVLYTLTASRTGSPSDAGPDASAPMPQARGRGAGALRSFCPVCHMPLAGGHCIRCNPPPGRQLPGVALDIRLADIFGNRGARRSGAEERPSDERASS